MELMRACKTALYPVLAYIVFSRGSLLCQAHCCRCTCADDGALATVGSWQHFDDSTFDVALPILTTVSHTTVPIIQEYYTILLCSAQ